MPRLLVIWCFVSHMRTFSKGNANARIGPETGQGETLSAQQIKTFAQGTWAGGQWERDAAKRVLQRPPTL